MGIIDEVKDRLELVELVRARVALKKAGRTYKGLCPFHQEKTPSFTVFPDSQRWKCFGCGESGDVLDFLERFEQVDFDGALELAARLAGVELRQSEEQRRAAETRRAREAVLTAAADHFEDTLTGADAAWAYAEGRGWTAETIQAARLGFWGGDWVALRKALEEVGKRDPQAEKAVLAMPPGMLVYPHVRAGRVHYLSARSIEGKKHYNLKQELVGPKHPYFNHAYRRGERVAVVEGQADAVTLGQWGIPAVAVAGTEVGKGTSPAKRLLEVLATHPAVVLAMDADESGERAAAEMAEALLGAGLTAVQVSVAHWPEKDANECLLAGGTEQEAAALLAESGCWLEETLRTAETAKGRGARRRALEAAARAYGSLDAVDGVAWRKNVCNRLELSSSELRQLVEAVTGEVDEGDALQVQQYVEKQGMLCRVNYGDRGEFYQPLSNFVARILEDVVEDDGEETLRRFVIEGQLSKGGKLPSVEVEAGEFSKMNWVLSQWGARATVAAGMAAKDHLRVAIATMSEPKTRYEYAHLGWRQLNGRMVYLTSGGAVGMDGVQVRIPRDMEGYRLPTRPNGGRAAVEASLRFLETGSFQVTVPLWAAMYLAPLASVLPPSFTLWLFGTTGSLKSTATALALCHFGRFSYNTPPASWTGTTNALEKKAFVAKDAPLWIDDYTAQSTIQGMSEIRRKADQLLRDWGNRAGRSRMRADLTLRRTFVPRGLIISTAEQLPPGQSILSRLFAVEVSPSMMTRGEGSALTYAQQEEAGLYAQSMGGYLLWLAERWATVEEKVQEKHQRYVEAARHEGEHLRMPGNVATMFVGWEMGLNYAQAAGALDEKRAIELRELGWQVLLGIGEQQHQVVAEEKPVEMYVQALEQMFAQGTVYLRNKAMVDSEETTYPAQRAIGAEHLGWYDDQYWYLLPKVAYGAVWRFYRASGVVFPDTERGVRVKLEEQGMLMVQGTRKTYRLRLGDDMPRVLRVIRPEAEEEGPEGA